MIQVGCINGHQPHVGEMVWICNYEGNCDNCGIPHRWDDNVPAVYVGTYQDKRGMTYDLYEVCVYKLCKCGGFTGTVTIFQGGFPADAFSLFAKVHHD